ncbi:MAG: oligosaccharide flippase family protein, partial [Flavobacteriales bacterium]|nr:oligosaccharide flippase family protein [Flavobacteriales bacterium]
MSTIKNSLINKALKDTGFYFVGTAGTKLVSIFTIPFITRSVSIEEFAIYDMFFIFSTFLCMIIGLGIDSGIGILISENKSDKKLLSALLSFSLFVPLLLLGIIWLGIIPFTGFLNEEYFPVKVLNLVFLYNVFYYINYIFFNFIRWNGNAKKGALVNFISSTLGNILGVGILYFFDNGIEGFFTGLILGSLLGLILNTFFVYSYLTLRLKEYKKEIIELLKLSIPFVPNYLANTTLNLSDRIVILSFLPPRELALYALTLKFAQIPNFFVSIIAKGLVPIIFQNHSNEKGKDLARKVYYYSHFSIIFIFLISWPLSEPFLNVFGGPKYIEAAYILPMVIVFSVINSAKLLNGFAYN